MLFFEFVCVDETRPAIYQKQGKPLLENVFHLFRLTAIRNLKVSLHRFPPIFYH